MTTQHDHPAIFGRRVPGCARRAELDAGSPPVRWAGAALRRTRHELDASYRERAALHFSSGEHARKCGPISTCYDY